MTNEERLLKNLEECRWEALRLLADEAEERGDSDRARGYRWLADNKKWPAPRRGIYPRYRCYKWRRARDPEEVRRHEEALRLGGQRRSALTPPMPLAELMRSTARVVGQWLWETGQG